MLYKFTSSIAIKLVKLDIKKVKDLKNKVKIVMIQMMNDHLSTTATILGPKGGRCTQV
jgi:hypothetical protein